MSDYMVTIGWDLKPVLCDSNGMVNYGGQKTDLLLHPEFFPNNKWDFPIDPKTGEKLLIYGAYHDNSRTN